MPTVEIGTEVYDSFVALDEADRYLAADVVRAAGWAAVADSDSRARALASATRMLLAMPWCPIPAPLPTDDVIDQTIRDVTAMLAADLLEKPKLFRDASGNSNVKIARAGSASVEFFKPVEGGPPIPVDLYNRLVRAGLVGCVSADGSAAPFVSGACAPGRPLGGRIATDWPVSCGDYD